MTQAIQTEIALLRDTKGELRNAIMEKGVTVFTSDLFSTYPTRISQISMTPGDKDNLFTDLMERDVTSVTIPTGTEIIRQDCFSDCTSLVSVTIPSTVLTIERNSFYKTALTTVEIPDSVESIGVEAFGECTSLTTVTIGSGVSIIEVSAFEGCTSLTSITCTSETPATIQSSVFYNTNNCPIYVPADSVDAYKTAWSTYASRIVGYSPYAVFNSIVDRSISGDYTIPSDVTSIGDYAFRSCTNLTSVTIPSGVTSIGSGAFYNCTGLTSVTIPAHITRIDNYAFNGCTSLTSVTVLATTPPTLSGNSAFYGSYPIYVPAASVETYKTASGWSTYASRITAIPS